MISNVAEEGPAWPQIGGNRNYTFQGKGDWTCFPVSGGDALVYTAEASGVSTLVGIERIGYSIEGSLSAFNGSNGDVIWKGESRTGSTIVGLDGQFLYLIASGSNLTQIDGKSGEVLAMTPLNFDETYSVYISIGSDGSLYVYSLNSNQIQMFDENLGSKGVIEIPDTDMIWRVLVLNDIVYACNITDTWAIDLSNQQRLWSLTLLPRATSPPAVVSLHNDALYFCLNNQVVVVSAATGSVTQTFDTLCSVIAIHSNTLVIAGFDLQAYEIDTGDLLWSMEQCSEGPLNGMAIGSNGTIFLIYYGGVAIAVDINTGLVKWVWVEGYYQQPAGLAIGSDGSLYFLKGDPGVNEEQYCFNSVAEEWRSSDVVTIAKGKSSKT